MRKLVILLACYVLTLGQLAAQTTRTVTGSVTDDKGLPLSGVTITALAPDRKVSATAISDASGKFSIKVSDRTRVLQFAYIGLEEQSVPVTGKNTVTAKLLSASSSLSEVVVVGYGTEKKRTATANIATVKGDAVAEKPVQSFEQALGGRAAGVQITIPNGVLNTPPVFRIQGTNSISLSSYPLIVVDGIVSFTGDYSSTASAGNALASINPSDIESIDILKDAAASAIYGSRAANGVVLITTKKGKPGKTKVTYDGWVGWTKTYRLPQELNAAQYTDFKNAAVANNPLINGTNPAGTGYTKFALSTDANGKTIDTKWTDLLYRTGFAHNHNVNVSGGNENTTYYFSVGYTDQQGVLQKNAFNRINTLFNIDSKINKFMTVGGKISYSQEKNLAAESSGSIGSSAFATAGLGRIGLVNAPNVAAYNNDGTYNINSVNNTVGSMGNSVTIGYYNPVMILALDRQNSVNYHVQANTYLQIKPTSWMTLKTLYGIDNLMVDNDIFYNPFHGDGRSTGGAGYGIFGNYKTWVWTNTAQFDYKLASKHTFSLLVGQEQQRRTSTGYGIYRTGLSDSAYTNVQAGWTNNYSSGSTLSENYLLSGFSRLSYNYANKYFISGNVRQDEYSGLGIKKGTFWGASLGWEITQEGFWQKSSLDRVFSSFRLKGSYGKVGNANVGDYASYTNYGSGLYGGAATLGLSSIGNPLLQWETSYKTNIGGSFGLFHDRLTAEINYYKNDISGLILSVPQAPSTGIGSPQQNIGAMYNKGLELTIGGTPILSKDFRWSSNFNITFNKNQVTALAPGLTSIQTTTSSLETVSVTQPGYSLGYLWVVRSAGVDAGTGKRIFLAKDGTQVYYQYYAPAGTYNWSTTADGTTKYVGAGGATAISQGNDAVMYQNTQPKSYGGWDNTFHYKSFDLNVLFTYSFGFYVYYGTNAGLHDQRFWNNATDVLTSWKKAGDITNIPKAVYSDNVSNGSAMPMDINVFKGDFVKLRNITLSYTLPKSLLERVKMSNARVYISGQNLAVFTKYPGPDPEVSSNGTSNTSQGVDRNTVGNARTITVGLNIGF
jgi:TonB-linked SusC/RagA family outer membrane protein